jgi:endonuclease/exonuclease/phosphatase family metal-dependent hydrolase
VQEMRSAQLDYMDGRLTDYLYYGVGRNTGTNSDSAERSGIFYKKSRFRLLTQGEFWLSETPTVPGTTFVGNGGDTDNPRMATWMKLFDFQSNSALFFINTHWSLDSSARVQSGALMREMITELSDGLPIIVTGDLNETATGGGYSQLARRPTADEFNLTNGYAASGAALGKTFHGYNGGVAGNPIDFVLHSTEDFRAIAGSIVRTTFDGYYPSDHYPVEVTMEVVPRIPGDYDRNGVVDAADIATWRRNFGSVTTPYSDGNGNGIVDAADYVLARKNFAVGIGACSQNVVPEPQGAMSLLTCVVLAVLSGRPGRVKWESAIL